MMNRVMVFVLPAGLQISHEQAAFIVLDKSNSDIVLTVNHGEGPDDVFFGTIMKTCADKGADGFVICDINAGKIIDVENAHGGYAVNNDSELYCIISEIRGEDETCHIVRYQLP